MIIRRCVPEIEQGGIMEKCHAIKFSLAYPIQRLF